MHAGWAAGAAAVAGGADGFSLLAVDACAAHKREQQRVQQFAAVEFARSTRGERDT